MIVSGFGLGIGMPIFTIVTQSAFDHSKLGTVTAGVQMFRSIGGTVGTAILGSVLNDRMAKNLSGIEHNSVYVALERISPTGVDINALTQFLTKDGKERLSNLISQMPGQSSAALATHLDNFNHLIATAFASSVGEVFATATIIVSIGVLAATLLPRIEIRGRKSVAPATIPNLVQPPSEVIQSSVHVPILTESEPTSWELRKTANALFDLKYHAVIGTNIALPTFSAELLTQVNKSLLQLHHEFPDTEITHIDVRSEALYVSFIASPSIRLQDAIERIKQKATQYLELSESPWSHGYLAVAGTPIDTELAYSYLALQSQEEKGMIKIRLIAP